MTACRDSRDKSQLCVQLKSKQKHYLTLHYGNVFSLWSEVQFLKIQRSKKIQEIQNPI